MYKGVTLDGDEVAIKVQYIDLQDRFKSDLKAMMYLLKAVTVIHPKFDLYWVLDVKLILLQIIRKYPHIYCNSLLSRVINKNLL